MAWVAVFHVILMVMICVFRVRNLTLRKALRQYDAPELWRRARSYAAKLLPITKLGLLMPQFTDVPDMSMWSQSIGGLIINFGSLEFQTLRWLQVLGGESAAIKAKGKGLSERIDALLTLLAVSNVSSEQQIGARALWDEVRDLSRIRNRIAHNPLCLGRDSITNEATFSVIDLKKMVPSGENSLEPLSHRKIAETAIRARDINRALSQIIETT